MCVNNLHNVITQKRNRYAISQFLSISFLNFKSNKITTKLHFILYMYVLKYWPSW